MCSAAKRRSGSQSVRVFAAHPYGSPDLARLRSLALRVLSAEDWAFPVDVIIADDTELRRLNRIFLLHDVTTDVLAFPLSKEAQSGGEIYISLDQARIQAIEDGESVQKAVERLLIHGVLHLGGFSDATDSLRRKMLQHGEKYLSERPESKSFNEITPSCASRLGR